MVIATRFRDLPDAQMKEVAGYVESGRPVVGMRTATHAFNIPADKPYARYGWGAKEWDGGFGRPGARRDVDQPPRPPRQGEHAGRDRRGGVRSSDPPSIRDGDIWGPTTSTRSGSPSPATASRWSWGRSWRA